MYRQLSAAETELGNWVVYMSNICKFMSILWKENSKTDDEEKKKKELFKISSRKRTESPIFQSLI